jgi:alkylation response protein AidB-like acyl-CoA dehydrogenase
MNFDYNEEQQLLADSVKRFIAKDYAFEARRKIVDSPAGVSDDVWATFAEMGLLGLPVPAAFDGFGGGALDMMGIMESIGEGLVVEPFLPTTMGAQFVARGGSPDMKKAVLPAVVSGQMRLAFAQTEPEARYDLAHVTTRATKSDDGWVINGAKSVVVGAPCAGKLVVSARTSGADKAKSGISLFLVDAGTPGVTMHGYRTLDEMRAADVTFANVAVDAGALIGREGKGLALIEAVVDYGTALVCAEAVGAMKSANDATLEYLKTRKQFGVPIGAFQALQHRMVDMVISYEQAKSMACLACDKVDSERKAAERKRLVSAAKVRVSQACRHVSQEAIQLHGGMGMTEEMKVSHTFRRLTMIAQQFGDVDHHLERFSG